MRVSVVIPARDDAEHLAGCLEALANQRVPPFEVVVVNNGSSDTTAAVASTYGARLVHEPRVGIAPAAAAGYDAATGEIIARLDADSRPPADWVEQIRAVLIQRPEVAAVTGGGRFYDFAPGLGTAVAGLYLGAYHLLGYAAVAHHVLWGSNMAMHRHAWRRARDHVHRDEADIHDDFDLSFALGTAPVLRVPTITVGVSARSLRGAAQVRRRFNRAFRTLRLGWAPAPPWIRWAQRLRRTPGCRPASQHRF